MANHKSAIKRIRQTEKRNLRNRSARSAIRTAIKHAQSAALTGNSEQAKELMKAAESAIAKGAAKGLYHPNNAARKVSRLAHFIAKESQA